MREEKRGKRTSDLLSVLLRCLFPNQLTRSFVKAASSQTSSFVVLPPFSAASDAAFRAFERKERWTFRWNDSENPMEVESPLNVRPDEAVGEMERYVPCLGVVERGKAKKGRLIRQFTTHP